MVRVGSACVMAVLVVAGCASGLHLDKADRVAPRVVERTDGCPTSSEVLKVVPPKLPHVQSPAYYSASATYAKLLDGRQCGYAMPGLQVDFTVRTGGTELYEETVGSDHTGIQFEDLDGVGDEAVLATSAGNGQPYARLVARFGTDVVDMRLIGTTPSRNKLTKLTELAAS